MGAEGRAGSHRRGQEDRYIEGFLAGQVVAYCERITTGSGLASQLVCPSRYTPKLLALIAREGCKSKVERLKFGRASIWIYSDQTVRRLIDHLQSAPASPLGMWSMGKLFGYADGEVINFLKRST